jgi:TonB family protein
MKTNKIQLRRVWFLLTLSLGTVLGAFASSSPTGLESKVQVFNVYRGKGLGNKLPEQVEGCDYLGKARASASGVSDPEQLLETIRSHAGRKGADTVFVSLARLAPGEVLRATVFRCGESEARQNIGVLVRQTTGGQGVETRPDCSSAPEGASDWIKPKVVHSELPSVYVRGNPRVLRACLTARIDETGKVTDVQVIHADSSYFGSACAEALMRWKFEPAKRGSMPIAVTYPISMNSAVYE